MKIKTINLKIEELINIYKNILFVKNNSSPFFTFDESTCSGHQLFITLVLIIISIISFF